MIGFVAGKILNVNSEARELIVMTGCGVGYVVKTDTLEYLAGNDVRLYIYTSVSENNISLWGFKTAETLKLFKLLLGVSGIGPSSAANLVMHLPLNEIVAAIISGQPELLKSPGLGTKTAQKIVLELSTKISNYPELVGTASHAAGSIQTTLNNKDMEEAAEALANLGYDPNKVRQFFRNEKVMGTASELVKIYLANQ
jgi:holliday junction DNA helicase RuvA